MSGMPKLRIPNLPAILKLVLAWLGWILALVQFLVSNPPPT